MKQPTFLFTLFATLLACALLIPANAAQRLDLSSDTAVDGDIQTLTLSLDEATTADVYLLLSSPEHGIRALKADGEFTASLRIAPRLRAAELAKGKTPLATWRVTGLDPAKWTWSVVLVKPGKGFNETDAHIGVAISAFEVKTREGPLFAELAEGRGGAPRGAAAAASEPSSALLGSTLADPGSADGFDGSTPVPSPSVSSDFARPSPMATPAPARPESLRRDSLSRSAGSGWKKKSLDSKDSDIDELSSIAAPVERAISGLESMKELDESIKSGVVDAERSVEIAGALRDESGALFGEGREGEAKGRRAAGGRIAAAKAPKMAERKLKAGDLAAAKEEIEVAKALTAGASDDNKDFGKFIEFLTDRNSPAVMCQDIEQRRFITVLDSKGRHVSNADIAIRQGDNLLFAGRTYANGQTLFCPSAIPELKAGKQAIEIEVAKGLVKRSWTVELDVKKNDKLANKFDPKQMPEQPMPIDIMPLPGCGCVKPMLRAAKAGAEVPQASDTAAAKSADKPAPEPAVTFSAESAVRALETKPVAVDAKSLAWLGDIKADFSAIPAPPPEREPVAAKGDWILRLPGALPAEAPKLDLVFQIDTTGSMQDEIRAVQATLQSVATRIASMDPAPRVRWGLVLYGDRGDVYVVRRYAFTPDVDELHDWINNMQMTGGGDTPESALEALHASVNEMAWDSGDAIRLVFLIADAPPHLDYKRPYTYVDKMKEAVAKGIKVIPTAASGLDKTGEYIFRQWAQSTMGQFLFITYGAGGAGGKAGESPHEVKQPKKKNNLDDLIVKAVADELDNWRTPNFYRSGDEKVEKPEAK